MQKCAAIIGSNGQDGQLLCRKLSRLNYSVIEVNKKTIDIRNSWDVIDLVSRTMPDEIYYLAAYHHSSQDDQGDSSELLRKSYEVHAFSVINFLDAILRFSPKTRFFYASSCLIFEPTQVDIQTELTQPKPQGAYAISKLAGMNIVEYYRNTHGLFASIGILYNHESLLRGSNFITQKIVQAALRISSAKSGVLKVGDLDARVDWGYAPEYVDAMFKILQLEDPDDFIIATGRGRTVREFADIAFSKVGLDYRNFVVEESGLLYRKNLARIGCADKLREATGWSAKTRLEEMVDIMMFQKQDQFL